MRAAGVDAAAELYRLPLAEFTPARDALARRLAASGDKAAAAAVKKLRKPSIPAWAVNQVVWNAPAEWRRLRAATASLRAAHETASSVDELRQAAREQRDALRACESRAEESLAAASHAAGPAVTMAVGGTLLALAFGAGEPGRLDRELQPPGFDVLLGLDLAPAAPPRPSPAAGARPAPPREPDQAAADARAREEAQRRAALAEAEARLAEARRGVQAAQAALSTREERRRTLERELEAVSRERDEAQRALAEAQAAEKRAAAEAARLSTDGTHEARPKTKGR